MPPVIELQNVSKEYRLGVLQGFKQSVTGWTSRLIGKASAARPLFTALDDVSFSVESGEVVGIIGHNGAGKSTLLKMLARISRPTRGSLKVNGCVAPLIEVGAGFIPDFTGRENVYLNGSILGMSKREIDSKFDEIVDFAEVRNFIDTPVKRYSSGMQVKLAFAVATSIDAEILIVDEVLAVGDLAFQRKCFNKMESLIKGQGRTVLLVSHNIRQVERICTRTMLLKQGKIIADGPSTQVCNLFYEESDQKILEDAQKTPSTAPDAKLRGSGEALLVELRLLDVEQNPTKAVDNNATVFIELAFTVRDKLTNPIFAVGFHTVDFLNIATPRSIGVDLPSELLPGDYTVTCKIDQLPLLPGTYALRTSISEGITPRTVLYAENLWHFHVNTGTFERSTVVAEGLISLSGTWKLSS